MSSYQTLIERKLICTGRSGDNFIYACPKCENKDTGHHLYVNYKKNVFHCFHCNYAGRSIANLVYDLGFVTGFDYESLTTDLDTELNTLIEESSRKAPVIREVDYSKDLGVLTQYFLHHVRPLSPQAYDYLISRGLTDSSINNMCLCEGLNMYGSTFTIKGKEYKGRDYSGRILIPSLIGDGTISFYVARDYIGGRNPKYLNPNQDLAYSSEDVWNLNMVKSNSVIICEGVMTAISANQHLGKEIAVATYGKSISERSNSDNPLLRVSSQGEKLLKRGFDCYYVCYDADATTSALNTCTWLYDRGAKVKYVYIDPRVYGEKADVNDLTRDQFLKLLAEAEDYDTLTQMRRLTLHD